MQGKLLVLRKEAGLSQQDMADKLGISVTSYGDKERGRKVFTLDEMFSISQILNKPIEDIFLPRKSPKRKQPR